MMRLALMPVVLLSCQVLVSYALPTGQKYAVVYLKRLYSMYKTDDQGKYPHVVQYGLELEGSTLILHLERNEDLISDNYKETHYLPDGTPIMTSPGDQIQDHCHYQGYVKSDNESLASISICFGISGIILTQGRRLMIEPLELTDVGQHAVYDAEEETFRTCGVMSTAWEEDHAQMMSSSEVAVKSQQKREVDILMSQKYIELYMVTDVSVFEKYGGNVTIIKHRIYDIVNYANLVFKILNIFVALTGIEIWNTKNHIEVTSNSFETLNHFAAWRKENILPRIAHDNAQLITNTDFDGAIVGKAYVGKMCSNTWSAAVIQDFTTTTAFVGFTVVHEMGHNLGMHHDDSSCSCSTLPCFMTPTISKNLPSQFSDCSLEQLKTFLLNNVPSCMENKPNREKIVAPAMCGNKFTDVGEECDCGTVQECTNPCCEAATCKMKTDAECAEGECCENCQFKTAGAVCRPSSNDCDLPDMCDGNSNLCTTDRFKDNGVSCMDGQGYCYNGMCPTLKNQCIDLWGPGGGVANDSCYNMNTAGKIYGHCKQTNENYIACDKGDVMCGLLYCFGCSDYPNVDANVVFFEKCRGVLDPAGMVKNGTKCGDNMVCYIGKCTALDSVPEPTLGCGKLLGQEIYDPEGHHCKNDWPLDCSIP